MLGCKLERLGCGHCLISYYDVYRLWIILLKIIYDDKLGWYFGAGLVGPVPKYLCTYVHCIYTLSETVPDTSSLSNPVWYRYEVTRAITTFFLFYLDHLRKKQNRWFVQFITWKNNCKWEICQEPTTLYLKLHWNWIVFNSLSEENKSCLEIFVRISYIIHFHIIQ